MEDEMVTSMDLMELMADWDYDFFPPAVSGEEAIKRVEKEEPDIILMDVSLSGEMSGIEAARRICERHSIPILFISGYPESEFPERIKLTCPYGYLTKPLDLEEMHTRMEELLSQT